MKKILFIIMSCVLCLGLVGGAFAYFSDTETSSTNSFTAGTLSIDNSLISSAVAFTIPNMAPGDVTGEYSVIIKNDGTINLAWLGDWQFTGSGTLCDALYIDYAKMEFFYPDGVTMWEPTDNFITNGTGSGPYPSWYIYLASLNTFGVVSFNVWNNNAGMVPGSVYEHAGALKPGYSYKLTVKFGFAAAAGNAYQGLGPVTATLKVDATQIVAAAITPYTGGWADIAWLNAQIAKQP